jgi:aldehyde:ferredoxin oxidoreductase
MSSSIISGNAFHGGYAGYILDIDLTAGAIEKKPLNPDFVKMHIGGKGFVARILYDELDASVDPISPENLLVFANGPMTGIAPASGRMTVGFRSPLTKTHGYNNVGGEFGLELKSAGYDIIIIRGKASGPVYLRIVDDKVEIKEAGFLWGNNTHDTIKKVRIDFEENSQVACIGPAGEHLVYYSGICFNPDRYAAQGGSGAVMGSKNLKAVAVVGTKGIEIRDRESWAKYYKNILDIYASDPTTETGRKIGSNFLAAHHNRKNALVVKNLQYGSTDISQCDGKALNERYVKKNRSGCSLCPIACQRSSFIEKGPYAGTHNNGPEYSSVAHLGWRLGIKNLENILYNCEMGDRLGLDLENTPCVIGFAMECFQRGIITKDDVDGYELEWGNESAVTELMEKIAYRKGIGNVFADGILAAVKHFGPESERYAMHVKGNDIPPNEPRSGKTYNIRYAIAPRGADHLQASGVSKSAGSFVGNIDDLPPEESMKWFKRLERACMVVNLLNVCNWAYSAYSSTFEILEEKHENLLGILNASTGWNLSMEDLQNAADRNIILERAINAKYGFGRKDDYLPKRMYEEPCLSEIDDRVTTPYTDFDERLDWYYSYTGIDKETGFPLPSKLREVGLQDVAEDMENLGVGG